MLRVRTSPRRPRVKGVLFVVLASVFLMASSCDPNGDSSRVEAEGSEGFSDPTGDDDDTTPSCGSAGVTCMVLHEDEDYLQLYELTMQILASSEISEAEQAEASVFNTVAALRLGEIDAETAQIRLEGGIDTESLHANVQSVVDEGLLETYVLQDKADEAAEIVSDADDAVIVRFRELRPELFDDLQRLVPADAFEQPLAPSG